MTLFSWKSTSAYKIHFCRCSWFIFALFIDKIVHKQVRICLFICITIYDTVHVYTNKLSLIKINKFNFWSICQSSICSQACYCSLHIFYFCFNVFNKLSEQLVIVVYTFHNTFFLFILRGLLGKNWSIYHRIVHRLFWIYDFYNNKDKICLSAIFRIIAIKTWQRCCWTNYENLIHLSS